MKSLGFFPRLFIAFLIVIFVAGGLFYLVANSLGPTLLKGHLESMGITHHNVPMGTSTMLTDLEVAYRRALTQSLFWAILTALIAGGGLSFFITTQVTRPIERMRRAARRIAEGEYQERVSYIGAGEISDLANDFNRMAETLDSVETQRSELIRNLAHEFRTPLMNLRGYIEGLEDGVFKLDNETLAATKRQLERLERLMTDLSLLSRVEAKQETVKLEKVRLDTILEAAIAAMRPQYLEKKIDLRLETHLSDILVMADPIRTEQALTNLLTNALRHTPEQGKVSIWTKCDEKLAEVHIKDSGEGISADALPHIFKRFYRSGGHRNATTGSGIGLTIAKYFVEAQGGTICVESREGQGSHFWFSLRRM